MAFPSGNTDTTGLTGNALLVHNVLDDLVKGLGPLLGLQVNFNDIAPGGLTSNIARPGATISITNFAVPFSAQTKAAGADYTVADRGNIAPIAVTLPNNVIYTSMYITQEEFRILTGAISREDAGAAYEALRSKAATMMLQGLAEQLIADYFATITAAYFTSNTVSAAGTFTRATERAIDKALFLRNVKDRTGGIAILHPDAYDEWVGDHLVMQNYTGQDQSGFVLEGGKKSQNTQFTFYRTNFSLPADAARGFVTTKTATFFVGRIPDEPTVPNDPVWLEATVHPSGFPVLNRVWKDANSGALKWVMATISKFQALQPEALQRITAS
jgi:hypothetical protein